MARTPDDRIANATHAFKVVIRCMVKLVSHQERAAAEPWIANGMNPRTCGAQTKAPARGRVAVPCAPPVVEFLA